MIERALLVVAALAIALPAGLWVHSAHLEREAQAIAERPPGALTPAQLNDAVRMFRDSRAHNPDTRPIEREGGLLIRAGRPQDAVALLRPVVRKEPDNLTAWALLAVAARGSDPQLARDAAARARALNPLGAQAR